MKKKKPLLTFLFFNQKKCGGNNFLFRLSEKLVERGYPTRVFSLFGKGWDERKIKNFFGHFWFFRKPEILIFSFWPTAYFGIFLPAKVKIYCVQNWEPFFSPNPFLSFFAKNSYRLSWQKIAVSRFLAEKLAEIKKERVWILPPAIEEIFFQGGEEKRQENRVLVVLSSYAFYKGIRKLLGTVKLLKKHYPFLSFVLVSYERKPLSSDFSQFFSDPPLETLASQYRQAGFFLQTSLVEGFPLPPLEAMASGCPVLLTDSGGVRDYAVGGKNCLIFGNPREIVEKGWVEKILKERNFCQKLVWEGKKTARRFTWEKTVAAAEKILAEVWEKNEKRRIRKSLASGKFSL